MNGWRKTGEVLFVRVDTFHDGSLDIELSNGNFIKLEIAYVLKLPGFSILREAGRLFAPQIADDRKTIYWSGGPRPLTVDEILALTGSRGGDSIG